MRQYDDYLRWLYRGGHPNRFARLQNRASAVAFAAGIAPRRAAELQITGRRTGRVISFPVVIADVGGERYLVSMLGANVNWMRNLYGRGRPGRAAPWPPRARAPGGSRARRPRPDPAALPAGRARCPAAHPGGPYGSAG